MSNGLRKMKNTWDNFWRYKKINYIPISIFKDKYLLRFKVSYIKKFISSNSSVLEVGCGDGKLLSLLPNDIEITGLDISSYAIKKANKNLKNKNVSLILGNVFTHEFKDNMFDLVLIDGLVEHYTEKIGELIKEIYRVTKKGGHIIIILANSDFIRKLLFKFIYFWGKERIKTTKEYKEIFNRLIPKFSKKYKIETIPKSLGLLMALVIKKC
jgi:ubiquinone/menaquinone biosynthesis C-methylase UbiE